MDLLTLNLFTWNFLGFGKTGGASGSTERFSNLERRSFIGVEGGGRSHLFFSLEAVSRGRPFSSTRLMYPPSSPTWASHSSNLARRALARAASYRERERGVSWRKLIKRWDLTFTALRYSLSSLFPSKLPLEIKYFNVFASVLTGEVDLLWAVILWVRVVRAVLAVWVVAARLWLLVRVQFPGRSEPLHLRPGTNWRNSLLESYDVRQGRDMLVLSYQLSSSLYILSFSAILFTAFQTFI